MGKTLHPTPHTLPPPKSFLPQTLFNLIPVKGDLAMISEKE
ncbi:MULTISPECIES: hypothetical protein [unclassified Microcystis]|nr:MULTISPECIES: hypothetical protein [unclassified Microcystis]